MKPKELLNVLRGVAPALSSKDVVPVFQCFCFEEDGTIVAYDGTVAMFTQIAENNAPIVGGVPGKVLLNFLGAAKGKELKVTQDSADSATFKVGRSKLDVSVLDPESFLHEIPEKPLAVVEDEEAFDAIVTASKTMGYDDVQLTRFGVTVAVGSKTLSFYSSDNQSATKVKVQYTEGKKKFKCQLPPRFVDLFKANRDQGNIRLELHRDWVKATFDDHLTIFAKTVAEVDTEQYKELFASIGDEDRLPVPKMLRGALDRSIVVVEETDDATKFKSKDGQLSMTTDTKLGKVHDRMKWKGEDCEFEVFPAVLRKCLEDIDELSVIPDSFVVCYGDAGTHIVSTVA